MQYAIFRPILHKAPDVEEQNQPELKKGVFFYAGFYCFCK